MNDLITIQELASAAGVSVQSVYKQLNKKLKPYLTVVEGKKLIKSAVLEDVYGKSLNQFNNQFKPESENFKPVVKLLEEQIEALKQQNDYLMEQNRQLTAMLNLAQQTIAAREQIKLLQMQQSESAGSGSDLDPAEQQSVKPKKRKKKRKK